MPILKLDPGNFQVFWPAIREALVKSCVLPSIYHDAYCHNALLNLLSGEHQAWIVFDWHEGEKLIHAFFTTILEVHKIGRMKYLTISSVYGYRRLNAEKAKEIVEAISEFARSQECVVIRCEARQERVKQLLLFGGLEEESTIYRKEL